MESVPIPELKPRQLQQVENVDTNRKRHMISDRISEKEIVSNVAIILIPGTFTYGTNRGSSDLICQKVMMDGKHMTLHHKRQAEVRTKAAQILAARKAN